jgi:hypothetical protein
MPQEDEYGAVGLLERFWDGSEDAALRVETVQTSFHRMYSLICFRKSAPSQNRQLNVYYH